MLSTSGNQWPTIPEGIVSICGFIYFSAWSISFYPQLVLNYRRKRTEGLSPDYVYLNPTGFLALTIWNWGIYFSPVARQQYGDRHGGHAPQVTVSDLAFSLHALVISLLWILQVWYYSQRNKPEVETDERTRLIPTPADLLKPSQLVPDEASRPSVFCQLLLLGLFVAAFISATLVWAGKAQFLDWLYYMSTVKLIISVVKYIPQVLLNWRLRSAEGFAIGNVILDIIGSIFSFIQLVVGSIWIENDPSGIIANPAKLGLAALSFFYDAVFFVQKYILFRNARQPDDEDDGLA